jgi:predicted nucleic-acid-binding protein
MSDWETRDREYKALFPKGPVTIADEALDVLDGDRQLAYGDPVATLEQVGEVWATLLDREPLDAETVALMMTALKLVRARRGGGRDCLVDAVGYLLIAERATS